jgi:hypothetical protein
MPLEAENLNIALKLLRETSDYCITAGASTDGNKAMSRTWKKGIPDAIVGLDLAIDALYRHTDFYKVGHKLFLRKLQGILKHEQTEKLHQLGVKL